MTEEVTSEWLQSAVGNAFYYLNPKPEQFDIYEIATVLSKVPRFAGHTKLEFDGVYSVAQHSVLVSKLCQNPLAGLLHDGHEAYIGDISTPLKNQFEQLQPGFKRALRLLTDTIDSALCEAFHMDSRVLHDQDVKIADLRALATEKRDVMAPEPQPWIYLPEPDSEVIQPMVWQDAREEFLARFHELQPHRS